MPRYSTTRGRELTRVEDAAERIALSRAGTWYLVRVAPHIDAFIIPRTHGTWTSIGRNQIVGVLRSHGAKTGALRMTAVLCMADDDGSILLVGSNYGRAGHPGWTANLRAHPECELTFAGSTRRYVARELEGDERTEAWDRAVDIYRGYAVYEQRAHPRVIRLFKLEAADA